MRMAETLTAFQTAKRNTSVSLKVFMIMKRNVYLKLDLLTLLNF